MNAKPFQLHTTPPKALFISISCRDVVFATEIITLSSLISISIIVDTTSAGTASAVFADAGIKCAVKGVTD